MLSKSSCNTPYFLFANFRASSLAVIHFNANGDTARQIIINPFAFELHDFLVTDAAIILAGYHRMRPVIIHTSRFSNVVKVIPGLYAENTELLQILINDDSSF